MTFLNRSKPRSSLNIEGTCPVSPSTLCRPANTKSGLIIEIALARTLEVAIVSLPANKGSLIKTALTPSLVSDSSFSLKARGAIAKTVISLFVKDNAHSNAHSSKGFKSPL